MLQTGQETSRVNPNNHCTIMLTLQKDKEGGRSLNVI